MPVRVPQTNFALVIPPPPPTSSPKPSTQTSLLLICRCYVIVTSLACDSRLVAVRLCGDHLLHCVRAGEEAGIKAAEVEVQGRYAFGYLSAEKGTHRLVRQSPFNVKGIRQTSFAAVDVMPVLGESHADQAVLNYMKYV